MSTNLTHRMLGALPAPPWHRPWLRYADTVPGAEGATPPAPAAPTPVPAPPTPKADELLGEPGKAALQAEREARKAADKELNDLRAKLQAIEDKDKTDQQRADDELAKTRQEIADLTVAKTRAEVAATKGVPVALLSGTTQAEVEASADALLQFKGIEPATPPTPERFVVPEKGGKPDLSATESVRPGIGTLRAAYAETEGK